KVEEGQALKTKLEAATGSLESLRGDYESLKRESEGYLKLKEADAFVIISSMFFMSGCFLYYLSH
ncbi:MAG: hypothetical protein P8175_16840, partial [Deltaproteobacteria bacterium]